MQCVEVKGLISEHFLQTFLSLAMLSEIFACKCIHVHVVGFTSKLENQTMRYMCFKRIHHRFTLLCGTHLLAIGTSKYKHTFPRLHVLMVNRVYKNGNFGVSRHSAIKQCQVNLGIWA